MTTNDSQTSADLPPTDSRRVRQVKIKPSFHVVVQCDSEADQEAMYEQLKREGRRCRVLTM